ncbi:hypothetical protein H257_11339 [Aphanomyces astaci]|uniref:Uncharacterized protein n=1 Tax=Aphanomyces astaci TaxID=112090 RepID=W4G2V9_APHAT|nr:hypothetical protein H257_11339 [Aphanomyces astaci]ETV74025.1 hypothetical protein H257_11339 [Aphanomyces astaci]|eukprot:XP_009836538.1 hypothetical protein H257_11339 [Aphanomyces astaci]
MRRLEETRQLERPRGPQVYTQDPAPGTTCVDKQTDRRQGSVKSEENGMHVEPSKEESSCRQTEPNTHDASALPDGDSLTPQGAASNLSRTQSRVRGTLATFPEETSDAQEPGDSTNSVLGRPDPVMACSRTGTVSAITVGATRTGYSNQEVLRPDSDVTPVFAAAQIDAFSRGNMAGHPDSRHVDIEERHYPIWLVGAPVLSSQHRMSVPCGEESCQRRLSPFRGEASGLLGSCLTLLCVVAACYDPTGPRQSLDLNGGELSWGKFGCSATSRGVLASCAPRSGRVAEIV